MAGARKRRRRPRAKFNMKMRTKLMILFGVIVVAMVGLIGRIMYLDYNNSEKYEKKVLSLQSYDSVNLPFQRGNIVDTNGTVLATSVAVYNVILDCSVMTSDENYIEPTIDALVKCFDQLDRSKLEDYARNSKEKKYIKLLKQLTYEETKPFIELQNMTDTKGKLVNPYIKGVWFETEYQRNYPFGDLASSVVGFVSSGDVGTIGLEQYYNETLNGVNGREFGYLNSDSSFEKTVINPENGNNLITSIDANVQSVVEQKILDFATAYRDNAREGDGAEDIAVVVMNPNNGEIIAMADYPTFDLNNPRDLTLYYTDEEIEAMSQDEQMDALNKIWQNYCVTATYEPGSVQKPFTVAAGLETGTITPDMTFNCDGYENISGQKIHCVNRNGHGILSVEGALMESCNDALMQMSYKIGGTNFFTYQSVFNFGLKTGIDLPGEANTSSLVYDADTARTIDVATNSFGQNYNCTMVQMASAFSSLINGGTYYQPHIVTKITDEDGNTISTVGATAVKQTVAQSTSDTLRAYLYNVVSEGTGATAKVDGYSMGGKTGTAQMYDEETHLRKKGCYLVSFMGFAPYDNPQVVIYCIINQPNVDDQAHSSYAQNIVREILEEILPYLNIYPDEEKTGVNTTLDITGNAPPKNYTGPTEHEGTDLIEDEKPFDDGSSDEESAEEDEAQEGQGDGESQQSPDGDSGPAEQPSGDGDENQ